jgi:hypothetical protein
VTLRILHLAVLACALVMTACAGLEPKTLNSFAGPKRPDSEVAVIRKVDTGLSHIDGMTIPARAEEGNPYYRDIRVLPGRHSLEVHRIWGASVMVSSSGYVQGSKSLTADFEAGHVYELRSDRTHGAGVDLFFWIEDVTANKVVAGKKFGGSNDKSLKQLTWNSNEKRIVILNPRIDLVQHGFGSYTPRTDWNEAGKAFAIDHLGREFTAKGIQTVVDKDGLDASCSPNAELGVSAGCAESLIATHRAHYALFLEVKDEYSSPGMRRGRAIALVAAPVLLPAMVFRDEGAPPPACLSLIEARTGGVVWRECLGAVTYFTPNWREGGSVRGAVRHLLRDFPTG